MKAENEGQDVHCRTFRVQKPQTILANGRNFSFVLAEVPGPVSHNRFNIVMLFYPNYSFKRFCDLGLI
jgi:hypothetical protein